MQTIGSLPGGYRASVDAGDPTKMYSPEAGYVSEGDVLNEGRKRKFSELQDLQASTPLSHSRYGPSFAETTRSGWRIGDGRMGQPHADHSIRNSISLAPDQTLESAIAARNVLKPVRPFWQLEQYTTSLQHKPSGPSGFADIIALRKATDELKAMSVMFPVPDFQAQMLTSPVTRLSKNLLALPSQSFQMTLMSSWLTCKLGPLLVPMRYSTTLSYGLWLPFCT